MPRFIVLTKTNWHEPPRLRHQLARLLSNAGHEVLFFVKPRYPWQQPAILEHEDTDIALYQHQELVHHRLRFNSFLRRANAYVVKRSLNLSMKNLRINRNDVVVNFNYDYFFLRDIFPANRIITVINDDFVDRALFGFERPQLWALARTCSSSDRVLTVSATLQEQLSPYCRPELFEPWTEYPYHKPETCATRDTLLIWGYINRKIDYQLVRDLASSLAVDYPRMRLLFVGPIERDSNAVVKTLRGMRNIEFSPPATLEELPINRILAALIPYRAGVPSIDVISNPNKALQILARGLPLMITGMPHFFNASFVTRVNIAEITQQIESLLLHFEDLQPAIEEFVSRNGPEARLKQFFALLD